MNTAVSRAVEILKYVASHNGSVRTAELSEALSLPRSSTYELVNTLTQVGLISPDGTGRVRLGITVFELGNLYAQSLDLISEARQVARRVVAEVNETVHVGVLDGRDVVYLAKEEGDQVVRMVSAIGRRVPAHGTAVGKVLLAFQPEPVLRAMLEGVELERMTANTITDVTALVTELAVVKRDGYATDDRESSEDVMCVAAPVRNHIGEVVAGISISVPASRMDQNRFQALRGVIVDAASDLSRLLGHQAM